MKSLVLLVGLSFPAVGCLSAATTQSMDRTWSDASARLPARAEEKEASLPDLSGPLRRETIIGLALSRSPGLASIAHRARAMVYGAREEGSLPSPELGVEAWNLPLARPYAVGDADMYMIELRQRFPAAGSLDAKARAMADEAHATIAELATEERQTAQRAAEAYADYVHGIRDHALHHEHIALLEQMQAVVRARFTTGGSGLADAARIELEIAKARRAIARIDGDIGRAKSTINALLRRAADAPLGEPSDVEPKTVRLTVDELTTRAEQHRGAFVAAKDRVQAAQARREAAQAEACWPEFMVGMGYWQAPSMRPGFGLNLSMSLPWLWGGQRHRVAEAEEREAAETSALAGASVETQREMTEARARLISAEQELRVLRTQALPAAHKSIDAVRALYPTGNASLLEWVDAARSFIDLEMEETDAAADLSRAVAALEASVGTTLPLTAVTFEGAP